MDHVELDRLRAGYSGPGVPAAVFWGCVPPRGMFKASQGPIVLCRFPLIFLTCGSEGTCLWVQGFPKGTPPPTGVRKPWVGLLGLGVGVCVHTQVL